MAKEVDLKKIELKVYVHCCDGCKIRVKKVLRSIEGVLKTEIDASQPKVTVLGNVNPDILIKKLNKAGKQAEIWGNIHQNAAKETKEVQPVKLIENDKSKLECEEKTRYQEKSCGAVTDKHKKITISDENKAAKKDQAANQSSKNTAIVKVTNTESALLPPSPPQEVSIKSYAQNTTMVEPYTINLPYYEIRSFIAPPHPTCCGHEHYHCAMPIIQPIVQASTAPQVVDYFNDENTVGCNIM